MKEEANPQTEREVQRKHVGVLLKPSWRRTSGWDLKNEEARIHYKRTVKKFQNTMHSV